MTVFETPSGYEAIETMARALDSMSENMEKLVELTEKQGRTENNELSVSGSFTWADVYAVEEETLEKASQLAASGDNIDFLIRTITARIDGDKSRKTEKLIGDYRNASRAERNVIDAIFIDLTGRSLAGMIRKYVDFYGN